MTFKNYRRLNFICAMYMKMQNVREGKNDTNN